MSSRRVHTTLAGLAMVFLLALRLSAQSEATTGVIEGSVADPTGAADFTKLTPGVTTVQSPDGEQLIVNGQKGIQNNVSVDGADFNNPSSANIGGASGRRSRSTWTRSRRSSS